MKSIFLVLILILSYFCGNAKASDFEFIATVNDVPISKGLYDVYLREMVSQGQRDTRKLREAIKNELINRQLITQEVLRRGIDKETEAQDQIILLLQNLYMQLYIDDYLKKNPITDAMLKQEYEKQKQQLGDSRLVVEYELSHIVLKSELDAIGVIGRLQTGDSFGQVAKEVSIDLSTKSQEGYVGWVAPRQMESSMTQAITELAKGEYTKKPIRLQNAWTIIRVNDIRSARLKSFELSKIQLKQEIIQRYMAGEIKRLRETAVIIQ